MDLALKDKTSFNQVKKTSRLRGCGILRLTSFKMVQTKSTAKRVTAFLRRPKDQSTQSSQLQ